MTQARHPTEPFVYGSCCFQDIRGSKWDQHPKYLFQICFPPFSVQCPYKISCLHFSTRFVRAPCGFKDKGVFKESQEGLTPKLLTFFKFQDRFACIFFSLNFFEKFLSGVWQNVCCSSHCFQDMKGPNRANAQNFNSFSLDFLWNFLHRIFKQIWLYLVFSKIKGQKGPALLKVDF